MKKKNMLRALTLCLVLVLIVSAAAPSALAAPAQTPYAELERGQIDPAEVDTLIGQAMTLAADAANQAAIEELVLAMDDWSSRAATWYVFDMIAFYQDTANETVQAAYKASSEAYTAGNAKILECWRKLLDTPCADAVRSLLTAEDLAALVGGDSELQVAMSAVTDRYAEAFETVHAGTYESETALALAVGELYLHMIEELKAIAGSGEEVVRLYYEMYDRAGTYADYEPMREAVREYIAPTMLDLWLTVDSVDGGPESGEEALEQIVAIAKEEFPALAEAADYLQTYGYYDVTPGENKYDGGFTTYLYLYEAPYLFLPTEGGLDAVSGISHELGHFCDYYTYGGTADLDSCEVHSQGLELLYTLYYDELFGDAADAAEVYELSNVLWTVVYGCLLDEFQYQAFVNTPDSPQALYDMYLKLLETYNLEIFSVFSGTHCFWAYVPHNFSNPMYYLSYAISALPALEIWSIAQSDPAYAKACYADFCVLSNQNGFEKGLQGAQLSSPQDGVAVFAASEYLEPLTKREDLWLFSDIADCWGATEIQMLGLLGGLNGYADGTYRPNATLTRAQAAKIFWNLFGFETGRDLAASDVSERFWAYDAVNFAVTLGAMTLDEDGNFRPNAPMTREDLAVMMMAMVRLSGFAPSGAEVEFTDADRISADCLEAVQAMQELGLMQGYGDGSYRPDAQLTRQQMAVVCSRYYVWLSMP